MIKTNTQANIIESEILTKMVDAMDLLNNIHCWGDETVNRDALWLQRERLQDAIRAMHDLQTLRKDLPFVHQD